jgi:hypothetical protein
MFFAAHCNNSFPGEHAFARRGVWGSLWVRRGPAEGTARRRACARTQRPGTASIETREPGATVRDFDFAFFDFAFGPAANGDGKPNSAQLHRHEQEIDLLLLNKISLGSPGAPCSIDPGPISLDLRGGEYFMILPFSGTCKAPGKQLQIGYDLMFDVDAQHRALIDIRRGMKSTLALLLH